VPSHPKNEMLPSRAIPRLHALVFAGILLSLHAAGPITAQGTPGAAASFPQEVLTWFLAGDADRVWEHVGPTMRELSGGVQGLRESSAEITAELGPETAILSEQVFEHPEGGGWHVYVRAARHAQVPELFWIVIFSPAERQVQMITAQPRQTIRTLFPQVRLP
jgi:hypothetical protein